jgi:hypothetical protein
MIYVIILNIIILSSAYIIYRRKLQKSIDTKTKEYIQ